MAQTPEERKAYQQKYREAHREQSRDYNRKYHKAHQEQERVYREGHKEEERERQRKWRETHLEQARETSRRHYAKHPNECRESARNWYAAHRGQQRATNRKWCEEHHEQRLGHQRTYAKKHSAECTAKAAQWAKENPEARKRIQVDWRWRRRLEIIKAYGGKCACCGDTIPEFLTIDHIDESGAAHRRQMGKSQPGFYTWLKRQGYPKDNFQLLCMNCNFAKGHKQAVKPNWRQKIHLEVIKEYGGECVCCGKTEPQVVLTIDHKDDSGAEHRRQLGKGKTFGGAEFYRWLKKQGYPKDNYQLLCMNCNFAKRYKTVCPHQKGKEWHKKWDA